MDIKKSSGIILHPTALPGPFGIGDFGRECRDFIDMLENSGTKFWQVLPLGFTDELEYSPYSSKSSILGNPYLVSLDLIENVDITQEEINNFVDTTTNLYVNYSNVYESKKYVFERIAKQVNVEEIQYSKFLENENIRKHIVFITLSEATNENWTKWDKNFSVYSENIFASASNSPHGV